MPARLFGEERVVWRDDTGSAHVWDNRCIHRGMRLQYGFVDGGRLACRYHGWRFGADARCEKIPAHPDMTPPEDFCVPAFVSAEAGGLIWTSLGSPTTPPDASELDGLHFCRTLGLAVDADDVAAILPTATYVAFEAAPGVEFGCTAGANGVYFLKSSSPDRDETVALALQPVAPGKSQLHLLAAGGNDDITRLRRHVSGWARRLRWFVENGAPDGMSWAAGDTTGQMAEKKTA